MHIVSQILTMLWLVAAGRGIAFVPASATRLRNRGGRVRPAAHARSGSRSSCTLLWLRESRNPALRQALHVLEQAYPTYA